MQQADFMKEAGEGGISAKPCRMGTVWTDAHSTAQSKLGPLCSLSLRNPLFPLLDSAVASSLVCGDFFV